VESFQQEHHRIADSREMVQQQDAALSIGGGPEPRTCRTAGDFCRIDMRIGTFQCSSDVIKRGRDARVRAWNSLDYQICRYRGDQGESDARLAKAVPATQRRTREDTAALMACLYMWDAGIISR
jgi:hypothetical protein